MSSCIKAKRRMDTTHSIRQHCKMKTAILITLVAVAAAAPQGLNTGVNPLPIAIVRQTQVNPDALGAHNSDFESANGIVFQTSGSQGITGGANMIGSWSYPMEDGTLASVSFVADENGFQPQSSLLPVAPAFPHPIPQFVLDQIEFARLQKEQQAREGKNVA